MILSVLTERRVYHPPGYNDGEDGACGLNILVRADGRRINLGPKAAVPVYAGVILNDISCKKSQYIL